MCASWEAWGKNKAATVSGSGSVTFGGGGGDWKMCGCAFQW